MPKAHPDPRCHAVELTSTSRLALPVSPNVQQQSLLFCGVLSNLEAVCSIPRVPAVNQKPSQGVKDGVAESLM